MNSQEVLYGIYDDEEVLLKAVHQAKDKHLEIMDVFSPFPVHGLEEALGLAESRLHQAGFAFGLIGTLTAFLGMTWIFTSDWPQIFGGKPYWSVPAFIPITFEVTVLFAAVGMTVAFFVICGLGPGVQNKHLDPRITDDKFCLAFDKRSLDADKESEIKAFLKDSGASEVHSKVL